MNEQASVGTLKNGANKFNLIFFGNVLFKFAKYCLHMPSCARGDDFNNLYSILK